MWLSHGQPSVYLILGYTDMRRSVNGLSAVVSMVYDLDPFSGHLFVFCNRRKTILKVLYYDRNGFCIWYKRLEKARFHWPDSEASLRQIEAREFMFLLEGVALGQVEFYPAERYSISI
jgi:transposase